LSICILPFNVTGPDKDQSATYDFLLVIHSNHRPTSYCFWPGSLFIRHANAVAC